MATLKWRQLSTEQRETLQTFATLGERQIRTYPPFPSETRNSGRVERQRGEGLGEFSIAYRRTLHNLHSIRLNVVRISRINDKFTIFVLFDVSVKDLAFAKVQGLRLAG